MLVIISDLHLTDGASIATTASGAFEIFAQRLQDLAMAASWRADGRYQPVDQIDLVLLGDIFDVIQSNIWRQAGVSPWDNSHSDAFVDAVSHIVEGVIQENQPSLATLRALAVEGAIRLPQASSAGQPIYNVQTQPAPVRTLYVVGNHDWPLHLRGASYDLLRQKITHHLGLGNHHGEPFPHDPLESEQLMDTFRRHRVTARHGDVFDPLNFNEDRDGSSLGDALSVGLFGGFLQRVQQYIGDDLPKPTMNGLREISHVRPLLCGPMWVDGLLQRGCPYPNLRKEIKQIWDEGVDEFLDLEIVRRHDTGFPFDLVDGLEGALKFSRKLSIRWAARIAKWLHTIRGADSESYACHALTEPDFRNRRARHIVYGHTHYPETTPLDASYADGFVLNQIYFNSGAWRRTYRPTQLAVRECEFIPSEQMTYLTFYQGDERGGRPYEAWTGSLGIGLGRQTPRRAVQGEPAAERRHSHHETPHRHQHAPHFRQNTWSGTEAGASARY